MVRSEAINHVLAIVPRPGEVLLVTNHHLLRYERGGGEARYLAKFMKDSTGDHLDLTHCFDDENGNCYCSAGDGVYRFNPEKWEFRHSCLEIRGGKSITRKGDFYYVGTVIRVNESGQYEFGLYQIPVEVFKRTFEEKA